ncbi:MAG: PHP domain-containing protein [Anaerolineae bacterium]
MKVDLHVHTYWSKDSLARPEQLLAWMHRRNVDVIAVTDHNEIEGAREMARLAPGAVIIGEEICTEEGEIIGLFLDEFIPSGLSPEQTVAIIHAQGGLAYVPHPVDLVRGSTITPDALLRVLPQVDLLEVYNARVVWPGRNRQARQLAEAHGLPMGAGSDAHRAQDVGLAYVDTPRFDDAASFLAALAQGQVHGRLIGLCGRLSATWARLVKGLQRRKGE